MAIKKFLDEKGTKQVIDWSKATFVQKEQGKELSTNDFTDNYKSTIDDIPSTYVGKSDFDTAISKKVEKVDGKALSTNDYTTAEKTKLQSIASNAEVNVITGIKRNGTVVHPQSKVVDIEVPTALSELTNDKNYATKEDVTSAISQAQKMSKEIVDVLPSSGNEMVMYLVPSTSKTEGNVYSEYLWINGKFEKVGDTQTTVDLSGYLAESELVAITTSEIEQMFTV